MPLRQRLILILLIIAGTLLRLYKLDASPWYDEIVSMLLIRDGTWHDAFFTFNHANNHLLYTLLTKGLIPVMGDNMTTYRAVPAIAGVLSIPAVYLLASLVHGRRAGIIAAFFVAFSFSLIHYSQEARGYSGSVLCAVLSTYFFLKMLRGDCAKSIAIYYSASVIVGALFHLLFLSVFFCHIVTAGALTFLGRRKIFSATLLSIPPPAWRRFFLASIAITVVMACVLGPLLVKMQATFARFTEGAGEASNLVTWGFLTELFGYPLGLPFNDPVACALLLLIVWVFRYLFFRTPSFVVFCISYFVTPLLFFKIVNPVSAIPGVLPVRFFIPYYPLIYILLAVAISEFAARMAKGKSWTVVAVCLLSLAPMVPNALIVRNYFLNGRQAWDQIFQRIAGSSRHGAVVVSNGMVLPYAFKFYKGHYNFDEIGVRVVPRQMLCCLKDDLQKWFVVVQDKKKSRENVSALYQWKKKEVFVKRFSFETVTFEKMASHIGYGGYSSSNASLYRSIAPDPWKEESITFKHTIGSSLEMGEGLNYYFKSAKNEESISSGIMRVTDIHAVLFDEAMDDFSFHAEGIIVPVKEGVHKIKVCYSCGIDLSIGGRKLISDHKNITLKTETIKGLLPASGALLSIDFTQTPSCPEPVMKFFVLHE